MLPGIWLCTSKTISRVCVIRWYSRQVTFDRGRLTCCERTSPSVSELRSKCTNCELWTPVLVHYELVTWVIIRRCLLYSQAIIMIPRLTSSTWTLKKKWEENLQGPPVPYEWPKVDWANAFYKPCKFDTNRADAWLDWETFAVLSEKIKTFSFSTNQQKIDQLTSQRPNPSKQPSNH